MSYLLVVLTIAASLGIGTPAIARESLKSQSESLFAQAPGTPEQPESAEAPPSAAMQSLQNRLAQLGYYNGPLDGIYSQATRDALAAFQRDSGLVGTGILDPLTQERLQNPDAPAAPGAPAEGSSTVPATPETPDAAAPTPASATDPGDPNTATAEPNNADAEDAPSLETGNEEGEAIAPAAPEPEAAETATEPEAAETAAEPASGRGLFRLALIGLVILALGSIGAAVLLRLARRKSPDPVSESEPPEQNGTSAFPEPEFKQAPAPAPSNGSHPDEPHVAATPINIPHQTMPMRSPKEPKIAKVNIIDELILELESPDPTIRRKTIWELGQRGNSAAVQPLLSLLAEADSQEQSLILAALAEINMKTLKPLNRALAMALQDPNPEVRKNAIRDLTRVYDSMGQASRILGHAIQDSDPEVRQTAHWALNQLNNLRLSATESAALLPDSPPAVERLPEDGSSSRSLP